MSIDPRTFRLSSHFVLSDFMGNHSIYAKGYANVFDRVDNDIRLENAVCLCQEGLEPLLEAFGPMSVSYGFISPEVSDKVVTYQNPRKPSHHLWDLGAACDFISHRWVAGEQQKAVDLYFPESARASPIALAHAIDYLGIPYSRLITYSESPYLCLAISAREFVADAPRKAFYENEFEGKPKAKPNYRTYATDSARQRALERLQQSGLKHPWQGGGWPSYHGGGFRQFQHTRVSKYTMLSDWLFDLQSISNGAKNIPSMQHEKVQDSFAAAGIVYDALLDAIGVPRMSIVAGYVSHQNPYFDKKNDWRADRISFCLNPPDTDTAMGLEPPDLDGVEYGTTDGFMRVYVDVETVLGRDWEC